MTRWIDVGALAELKFGPGAPVKVEGRWLAVFRLGDGFGAIDNACPHGNAPLCDGTVFGERVACFLHGWEFDLRTGACDVGAAWNVRTYAVEQRGDRLFVAWPDG